jgi:hypothetical protein
MAATISQTSASARVNSVPLSANIPHLTCVRVDT